MGDSPGETANSLFNELQRAKENLEDALKRGDARAVEALRVRSDALQQRWRSGAQAQIEQIRKTATAPAPPASLSTRAPLFPPAPITSGVGVCLSGGGSRAASASMGELRGLRSRPPRSGLGALDGVRRLLGGFMFTYLPSNISDDEFLGDVRFPATSTWEHHSGETRRRHWTRYPITR